MLKELLAKLPQQKGKKATPEEEFAAYRYFEKLMTVYSISMLCGKIMSVLFYTWALFGLFSVQIVYEFSLARIASLSMTCAAPYIICGAGSWEAKNFLSRMVHIPSEQKDQLFKAYQRMRTVSLLLGLSHGGIAVISMRMALPLPNPKVINNAVTAASVGAAAQSAQKDSSSANLLVQRLQALAALGSLHPATGLALNPAAGVVTGAQVATDLRDGTQVSGSDITAMAGNAVAIIAAVGMAAGAPVLVPTVIIGGGGRRLFC